MKWKKKTGIVLGVLLFLVFICIDKIDTTPVFFTQAYQHTLQSIENTSLTSLEANTLQAGWAKVNITPNHSTRMAGFRMKSFNDVHDSVYVRCMLFDVGGKKIAWLSFDLIFVHPYLKNAIEQKVNENNLADFVYYTATHTHHSIGGWASDPLARILYGYDKEVFDNLTQQATNVIVQANKDKASAKAGFFRYNESRVVRNRVDRAFGIVDPYIRGIKVQKESGETACLYTFSAHPTSVSIYATFLTGDYPAEVTKRLEQTTVNFAMFSAGATASMRAKYNDIYDFEAIDWFADRFVQNFDSSFQNMPLSTFSKVKYGKIPLQMRQPNLRFAQNWRFRPWLVKLIVDQKEPSISLLQLDNMICLGTPVEFSGELMVQLDAKYQQQNVNLVLTGFNGNYLGYVNRDCYYHTKPNEEVSLLNWYGPDAGAFYRNVIEKIIDKTYYSE